MSGMWQNTAIDQPTKSHTFPRRHAVHSDGNTSRPGFQRHITPQSLERALPSPPPYQPIVFAPSPKRPPRPSVSKTLLGQCQPRTITSPYPLKQSTWSSYQARLSAQKDQRTAHESAHPGFHFVGPDHTGTPHERTILGCLILLITYIAFLGIAARFPKKAVRILLISFSGVGLAALAIAIIVEFKTHGQSLLSFLKMGLAQTLLQDVASIDETLETQR